MASLQSLSLCSCHTSSSARVVKAAIHVPDLKKVLLSLPKLRPSSSKNLVDRFTLVPSPSLDDNRTTSRQSSSSALAELYMILEVVSDRIEMHKNICEQRNNWNTLLLNSVNMIILAATAIAGLSAAAAPTSSGGANGSPLLALKLSSFLMFSISTGLLVIMNKIQPSQLVEEQRNATRLFSQIRCEIKIILAIGHPTEADVKIMMGKILALDKAYPLPLLGAMLEKFPQEFEPAKWWPKKANFQENSKPREATSNGWTESLENEMREILKVIKTKDIEDYIRLGSMALKVSKVLAAAGPILTSIAAVASPFVGVSSNVGGPYAAAVVAVAAGGLASIVTVLEHGGQVGMVFEMYRNCAGFFGFLEESIQSTLDEPQLEKRENGEVFEMKVALKLGRSLSQLRNLAATNNEFASKLF